MRKTQARKQLDAYIDICLDCSGKQTEENNCHNCTNFYNAMKIVQKIREERKEQKSCTAT